MRGLSVVFEEIWKPIPFALNYEASNLGFIITAQGRLLRPVLTGKGYFVCDLNRKQYRVNRIICWTFHGAPPTLQHHAAHKNNDSTNNEASNLYWATALENARDLDATGKNKGINSQAAILTEADVFKIRQLRADGVKAIRISEMFPDVTYPTIQAIIHRRSWKHLS